jgi:hypothetical protein
MSSIFFKHDATAENFQTLVNDDIYIRSKNSTPKLLINRTNFNSLLPPKHGGNGDIFGG